MSPSVNPTGPSGARPRGVVRIPLQLTRSCIVASLQVDLDEEILQRFRSDLLERVRATGVRGVILDVAGLEIIDSRDFTALRQTMVAARVMGARCIVVGLRPGVVSALVDLDVDVFGMEATFSLDDAFAMLAGEDPRGDT